MSGDGIIAVIPARKGSKGLPGKNIKPLCGKPLLAYTVEQALAAGCFERVIVSTDCAGIADVAREYGAEVPFLRPTSLAGDTAGLRDVLRSLLDELAKKESYRPDAVATMFPTYPFRTVELIRRIARVVAEEALAARCVYPSGLDPHMLAAPPDGGGTWRLRPLLRYDLVAPQAHRARILKAPMGNIGAEVVLPAEFSNARGCVRRRRAFFEEKIAQGDGRYENWAKNIFVDDPVLQIDINYESDFQLAEMVLERGLFDPESYRAFAVES